MAIATYLLLKFKNKKTVEERIVLDRKMYFLKMQDKCLYNQGGVEIIKHLRGKY